jgi:hypothetical protein
MKGLVMYYLYYFKGGSENHCGAFYGEDADFLLTMAKVAIEDKMADEIYLGREAKYGKERMMEVEIERVVGR